MTGEGLWKLLGSASSKADSNTFKRSCISFNTARTKPTQLKSHKVLVTPNINLQPSPLPPRKKFKQFEDDFDDFEFS